MKAVVELEDLGMSPDVGAVVADEDGDIAEDADLAFGAVGSQGGPLLIEEELDDLLDGEVAAALVHHPRHGVGLAGGVLGGPLVPAEVVEAAAKDGIDCVVGEPGDVVLAEALEAEALFLGSAVEEVGCGFFDQRNLLREGGAKVARALVSGQATGNTVEAILGEPSIADQELQADEQWIAGEGGERRVG